MKCKKCGAEINSKLKFCNKCGAKVTTEELTTKKEKTTIVTSETVSPAPKAQTANTTQIQTFENVSTSNETIQTTNIEEIKNCCQPTNNSTEQTKIVENSPPINNSNNKNQGQTQEEKQQKPIKPKSKKVAGWLAIFLGFFGVQWFYLGKPVRAVVYIVVYLIFPYIWFLYIVEGIFFLCAKQETFDKYRSKFKYW